MKRVLVIAFQPYNEMMYPHAYEFLKIIENPCDLVYFGGDDRGSIGYALGLKKPNFFHPLSWAIFFKHYLLASYKIRGIQKEIKKLMNSDVDIVIAIDHSALHYACKFLKEDTKLVFWSLDIISQDHIWMDSFWIRELVKKNQKEIKKCDLIIVQDGNRAAVLDSILGSHDIPKFYLPVSLLADAFSETESKRRQSQVLEGNISLVQMGTIHPYRSSDVILEAYQKMPDNVLLIFKGFISSDIQALVEKAAKKPIVYPRSTTFEEMREIINQADIGIIAGGLKDLNSYFFSRASGQLVEYLRFGIPVIVLDVEELGEFVETNKCGLSIPNVNQLDCAIEKIVGNYSKYSKCSYDTFRKYFDIDLYRGGLINEVFS
jgi:glycosyltransferase involved in cell wall biosynthesis